MSSESSVAAHDVMPADEDVLPRSSLSFDERVPSDVLKRSKVLKLGSDFSWKTKLMLLSEKDLWFRSDGDISTSAVRVGLHEISSVRSSLTFGRGLTSSHPSSVQEEGSGPSPGSDAEKPWARALSRARTLKPGSFKMQNGRDRPGEASFNDCSFDIITTEDGMHSGRIYTVRVRSSKERDEWVQLLSQKSRRCLKEHLQHTRLEKLRARVRNFYNHPITQFTVGVAIVGNFVAVAIQAQIEPMAIGDRSKATRVFEDLNLYLTLLFAVELAVNMFGSWFWPFVNDPWSVLDFVVVSISVLSLVLDHVHGMNILRVLRAFRVLRVIKRFDSLLRITNAILQSTIPVLNALLILLMVSGIYAVMGVVLFAEANPEMFGNFGRSLYTMFELLAWEWTGPSVLGDDGELEPDMRLIVFLVSFMVLGSWTLLQVVVAVLLDNFIAATEEHKLERRVQAHAAHRKPGGPLDPLLESLSRSVDTEKELEGTLTLIWNLIDEDATGTADFEEVRVGLLPLNLAPQIRLTEDDYAGITQEFGLCDAEKRLSRRAFSAVVTNQLRIFLQRKVSEAAAITNANSEGEALLQGLKQVLMAQSSYRHAPPAGDRPAPLGDWEDRATRAPDDGMVERLVQVTEQTARRVAALEASSQALGASLNAKLEAIMAALQRSGTPLPAFAAHAEQPPVPHPPQHSSPSPPPLSAPRSPPVAAAPFPGETLQAPGAGTPTSLVATFVTCPAVALDRFDEGQAPRPSPGWDGGTDATRSA